MEQMYVLYLSPIKTGKRKHLSVLCFHLPSAGLKNNRDGGGGGCVEGTHTDKLEIGNFSGFQLGGRLDVTLCAWYARVKAPC